MRFSHRAATAWDPVLHVVVGEDDTVHGDHSMGFLGPERHLVIDINRAVRWRRAR